MVDGEGHLTLLALVRKVTAGGADDFGKCNWIDNDICEHICMNS